MKKTLKISEEETSAERILRFLDLTRDYNSLHRKKNIFPGMFYLALSAPYLTSPIKSLELKFNKFAEYPCNLDLSIEDEDFTFRNENGEILCKSSYKFGGIKDENYKLNEFAEILRIGENHPNLQKILSCSLIPGELIKHLGEEGFYVKQKLIFKSDNLSNTKLELSLDREIDKFKWINTNYVSKENIVAEGKAIVGKIE